MRVVLGCSIGGAGHLLPVISVGRALERLGHEPVLLVPPVLEERARTTGLSVVVGAEPPAHLVDEVWERTRRGSKREVAGLIDREVFARLATDAMLAPARDLIETAEPDLIVREPCEYATAVVAHQLGTPQAQVAISQAWIEAGVLDDIGDVLDARGAGVVSAIAAAPYLTRFPASLDPSSWVDTRRFHEPMSAMLPLPDWWPGDDRPLIYLSFGSVFGRLADAADIYRTAIRALADLPARILVTLGNTELALASTPDNVHIERWVPQESVLDQARLVVCHGGSGTVFGALAAGVPLLVCPFFADQGKNGEIVQAAGAGRVLESAYVDRTSSGVDGLPSEAAEDLRRFAEELLTDIDTFTAAQRIAAEMAETRTLDGVLDDLLGHTGHR